METRRQYRSGWVAISGLAVIVCVGFGAWWTAVAAHEGEVGSMFVRFGLSTVAGAYYAVLHQVARGGELKFGFQKAVGH